MADLVRQGETEFSASNGEFGRDPAPNHVKRLRVKYTLDGKPQTQTVAENDVLTLPEPPGKSSPAWSVAGEAGRPWLTTSTNGSFEFRTAAGRLLRVEVEPHPGANLPG